VRTRKAGALVGEPASRSPRKQTTGKWLHLLAGGNRGTGPLQPGRPLQRGHFPRKKV